MFQRLTVQFETAEEFRQEFQRNIANGGTFIQTEEFFEIREVIEVELQLRFCDACVVLPGEIVSRIGLDLVRIGGKVGVAVQFLDPADELRRKLNDFVALTPQSPAADWSGRDGPTRRLERTTATVSARIGASEAERVGQTRDLSGSGALLSVEGEPIPVGQSVKVALVHPRTGEEFEVGGEVVRHCVREGQSIAIAVRFTFPDEEESSAARFIEELRCAEHARRLGSISGPIETLGLANLIQMFASSAEEGTVVLSRDDARARIIFGGGALYHVNVGAVTGIKALSRLLAWESGGFEFYASADVKPPDDEPVPVFGAVLEATARLDELRRADLTNLPADGHVSPAGGESDEDLAPLERALLELASPGATVQQILDVRPEPDEEVYAALASLLAHGLVRVDA